MGGEETHILQNVKVIKDKERLWRCSQFRKTKETWQLISIPNSRLNSVLEGKKFHKGHYCITESINETGKQTTDYTV